MALEVKIDVSEIETALDRVQKIVDAGLNWRELGIDAELSVDGNFEVEGRYNTPEDSIGGTTKWQKRKREPKDGHPILSDTMKLRQSISSTPLTDGVEVTSTGLAYNAAQNYGKKDGTLPARPFMNLQPDDIDKISASIEQQIIDAFEAE